MPLLFSRLAGREALAWLKHRRWWVWFGEPSPHDYEIPRWTEDGTERVTEAGVLRTVLARPRRIVRTTEGGTERVTEGGVPREVTFAT